MRETIQIRCAIEGFCTQCLAKEYQTAKGQNTIQKLGEILKHQKEALALDDNYEAYQLRPLSFVPRLLRLSLTL